MWWMKQRHTYWVNIGHQCWNGSRVAICNWVKIGPSNRRKIASRPCPRAEPLKNIFKFFLIVEETDVGGRGDFRYREWDPLRRAKFDRCGAGWYSLMACIRTSCRWTSRDRTPIWCEQTYFWAAMSVALVLHDLEPEQVITIWWLSFIYDENNVIPGEDIGWVDSSDSSKLA